METHNLPKAVWTNLISRVFGKFASFEFPGVIQAVVNKSYVKLMKVDLSNFYSASQYSSLNALFTRALLYERNLPKDTKVIISPADSLVTEQGNIHEDTLLQIKGMSYSLKELLTEHIEEEEYAKVKNGAFMNFYLSPRDYHRYHVPLDLTVTKVIHVPGALYPVNFTYLKKMPSLFVKNERVILECSDNNGKLCYIILVGALNVGQMTLSFEPSVTTNIKDAKTNVYEYSGISLKRGEELGMFKMGSTVVMIFEEGMVDLSDKFNHKVRFGEEIAIKV